MKFKFTNSEILSLILLFKDLTASYRMRYAGNEVLAEKLLCLAVFEDFYISLQRKALIRKPAYTVRLTPVQALAFWIELNNFGFDGSHIGNIVNMMCNKIHQQVIANVP